MRNFLIIQQIFIISMKFFGSLILIILYLFQVNTDDIEMYNFILVFFGIILLIIILVYILLSSKQD